MTFAEVNLGEAVWKVPGSRMKAAKEQQAPLSDAAVAILKDRLASRSTNNTNYVFASPMPVADAGVQVRRPLTNQALADVMKRLGVGEFTVHGSGRASDHGAPILSPSRSVIVRHRLTVRSVP
jgi:hypothetical protein